MIPLETYYQHPNFNAYIDYDICVLKFSFELSFDATVGKISLPAIGQTIANGTFGVVTGWGNTEALGRPAYQLQAVELPILSQETCKAIYKEGFTDRMLRPGFLGVGGCHISKIYFFITEDYFRVTQVGHWLLME